MKIWIFAELSRRRLSQVALELISCARGLAADAKVTAVLIGHDLDAAVREAAAVGAAQIIAADHVMNPFSRILSGNTIRTSCWAARPPSAAPSCRAAPSSSIRA